MKGNLRRKLLKGSNRDPGRGGKAGYSAWQRGHHDEVPYEVH